MRGASFITTVLIVAVFGMFFYGVAKVVDPMKYFHEWRDDNRKASLKRVQVALEQYYRDNGQYPQSTGSGNNPCEGDNLIRYRNPNTKEVEPVRWGTKWFGYLEPLPKEPNANKCYVYEVSSSRQSYWLYASLDRGLNDPKACGTPGIPCNHLISEGLQDACHKAGTDKKYQCNYGLSSANESL